MALRRTVLAVFVAAVLLALAPFAAALEIHHALAAVDHDGHQHSDSDLCQWVQHHTSTSLFVDAPPLELWLADLGYDVRASSPIPPSRVIRSGFPRAPPVACLR